MCDGPEFIYKYMTFERFVEMVEKEKLYLTRVDCWEDVFEGAAIKKLLEDVTVVLSYSSSQITLLKKAIFHSLYAQSWCSDNRESDAMWRIYSPNSTGVRVKFKREDIGAKIKKIEDHGMEVMTPFLVKYDSAMSYAFDVTIIDSLFEHISSTLECKRPAFEHEHEYRFVMIYKTELECIKCFIKAHHVDNDDKIIKMFINSKEPVISYNIDMADLREVLLDPRATKYFEATFKMYCKNRQFKNMNIDFKKSMLYTLNA
jgi:hypothetical protein